jgi:SAM-dependent methyltransferase
MDGVNGGSVGGYFMCLKRRMKDLKVSLKQQFPKLYSSYLRQYRKGLPNRVAKILACGDPAAYYDSENAFRKLQDSYKQWWPDYRFDDYGFWARGANRSISLMEKFPQLQKTGLRVLEAGCGDAVTGYAFSAYGHRVILSDLRDWRDQRAKHMPFARGNLCGGLPFQRGSFDLVMSFNVFEHLAEPFVALQELSRVCANGGCVYIEFDPLFCSPLGLHAYCFRFPYPQFIFSQQFIEQKVREIGVYDLGETLHTLQWTNRCRIGQYRELWKSSGLEVISEVPECDYQHLNIVENYPTAFTGHGLTVEDLVTCGVAVMLRKTGH